MIARTIVMPRGFGLLGLNDSITQKQLPFAFVNPWTYSYIYTLLQQRFVTMPNTAGFSGLSLFGTVIYRNVSIPDNIIVLTDDIDYFYDPFDEYCQEVLNGQAI